MIKLDISKNPRLRWTNCNVIHNNNGPAIDYGSGIKDWYKHGQYHRLDGPAVTYSNGYASWYIDGVRYNDEFTYWLAVQNYDKT